MIAASKSTPWALFYGGDGDLDSRRCEISYSSVRRAVGAILTLEPRAKERIFHDAFPNIADQKNETHGILDRLQQYSARTATCLSPKLTRLNYSCFRRRYSFTLLDRKFHYAHILIASSGPKRHLSKEERVASFLSSKAVMSLNEARFEVGVHSVHCLLCGTRIIFCKKCVTSNPTLLSSTKSIGALHIHSIIEVRCTLGASVLDVRLRNWECSSKGNFDHRTT